jgi:hypothetical protein
MHTAVHTVYDIAIIRNVVPECTCTPSFAEGIRRTIRFYQDHPEYQKVNEDWNRQFDGIMDQYHG